MIFVFLRLTYFTQCNIFRCYIIGGNEIGATTMKNRMEVP